MSSALFLKWHQKVINTFYNKVSLLKTTLRQMALVKCLPIQVLSETTTTGEFTIKSISKTSLRQLKVKGCLLTTFLAIILLQVSAGISSGRIGVDEQLLGCSAIFMLSVLTAHCHLNRRRSYELIAYFNGLLNFTVQNAENTRKKFSLVEFLNISFVPIALINGAIFPPAFTIAFHWQNPCRVSLAGYGLLLECQTKCAATEENFSLVTIILGQMVKIVVFTGNCWVWYFGIHCTIFTVTAVEILCTFLLRDGVRS